MILVSLALKEQCHCIFSTRVHEYSKVMWDSLHCARKKPNSGFYGNQHNQLKLLYYVDKMYEPCAPDECLKNTKEYSSCKITNIFQLQNHKYFSCNFKVQKIPARVKKKPTITRPHITVASDFEMEGPNNFRRAFSSDA